MEEKSLNMEHDEQRELELQTYGDLEAALILQLARAKQCLRESEIDSKKRRRKRDVRESKQQRNAS